MAVDADCGRQSECSEGLVFVLAMGENTEKPKPAEFGMNKAGSRSTCGGGLGGARAAAVVLKA